jgi:hypothetical protein
MPPTRSEKWVSRNDDASPGYTYRATVAWFIAGGMVTAPFSASLARLTTSATFAEVILVGMFVPCFTWVVQTAASGWLLPATQRRLYWGDLGRTCFWGSVALLPAAAFNLVVVDPPRSPSAANVLASVLFMTADLYRRSTRHGVPLVWPLSFLPTICFNMALFLWASRHWWTP